MCSVKINVKQCLSVAYEARTSELSENVEDEQLNKSYIESIGKTPNLAM